MAALIPKGVEHNDVFRALIKEWKSEVFGCALELPCGVLNGQPAKFRVFFTSIIADSVEANPLIGMLSHSSSRPCRFCLIPSEDLGISFQSSELRKTTEMVHILSANLQNAQNGNAAAAQNIRLAGLRATLSPFILLFAEQGIDVYKHSPYDLLHQVLLGTVRTHITTQVSHMTEAKWRKLDARLSECKYIGHVSSVKYASRWTGEESAKFMSVALLVLRGLIPPAQMQPWIYHAKLVSLLSRGNLAADQLDDLDKFWPKFCRALRRAFPHLRFKGINMHVGVHWSSYIRMFGTPKEFATGRFEALHADVKAWKKTTNHQNPATDIGIRVSAAQMMRLRIGSWNTFAACLKRRHRTNPAAPATVFPKSHGGVEFHSRLTRRQPLEHEKAPLQHLLQLADIEQLDTVTPYGFIVLPSRAKVREGDFVRYLSLGGDLSTDADRRNFLQIDRILLVRQPGTDEIHHVCIGYPLIPANIDNAGEFDKDTGLMCLVRLGQRADLIAIFVDQITREEMIQKSYFNKKMWLVNKFWRSVSFHEKHAKFAAGL